MKKYFIYIWMLATLSLIGCDDENFNGDSIDSQNLEKVQSNYARLVHTKKKTGSTLIQSNANYLTQHSQRNISLTEALDISKSNGTKVIFTNLDKTIFAKNTGSGNSDNLESAFGHTLEYKVTGSTGLNNKSGNAETSSFYLPQLLNVQFSTSELQVGTVISWNVDVSNTNGLVVYVNYNPANQPDVQLGFQNPTHKRDVVYLTEQMGSYTVTAEDLQRFPDQSFLSVDVIRAGFSIIEDEPVVAGLTKVNNEMKVIK